MFLYSSSKMPKMTICQPAYVSSAHPYFISCLISRKLSSKSLLYWNACILITNRLPRSGQKVQDPAPIRIPLRSWIAERHRWNFADEERTQGHLHGTAKHRRLDVLIGSPCSTTARQWDFKTDKIHNHLLLQVEIEVPQMCSFIVRTTGCSLSQVVDMDAAGNPVFAPAPTSSDFAAEMERWAHSSLKCRLTNETLWKPFKKLQKRERDHKN